MNKYWNTKLFIVPLNIIFNKNKFTFNEYSSNINLFLLVCFFNFLCLTYDSWSPCVHFTHTKICLLSKFFRAFALNFSNDCAKSRDNHLVKIGLCVILYLNYLWIIKLTLSTLWDAKIRIFFCPKKKSIFLCS